MPVEELVAGLRQKFKTAPQQHDELIRLRLRAVTAARSTRPKNTLTHKVRMSEIGTKSFSKLARRTNTATRQSPPERPSVMWNTVQLHAPLSHRSLHERVHTVQKYHQLPVGARCAVCRSTRSGRPPEAGYWIGRLYLNRLPPRGHRADDSTPQARDKRPHKWGLV